MTRCAECKFPVKYDRTKADGTKVYHHNTGTYRATAEETQARRDCSYFLCEITKVIECLDQMTLFRM